MSEHDRQVREEDKKQVRLILQLACIGGMVVCAVLKGSQVPFIVYASLAAGFLGTTQFGEILDKLIKLRSGR